MKMTGISSNAHRPNRYLNRCGVATRLLFFVCRSTMMLVTALVFATILVHQHNISLLAIKDINAQIDTMNSDNIYPSYSSKSKDVRSITTNVPGLRLRYDWTNLSPSLDLTTIILKHQSNCSMPMSSFTYRNRFGLGSDLHVYSQALGYGMKTNRRIRTVGNWTWMDQNECGNVHPSIDGKDGSEISGFLGSPMRCYFASSELNCPGDVEYAVANPGFDTDGGLSKSNGNLLAQSGDYASEKMLQTAVVESLFIRVTPLVVREAERQLNLIFGGTGMVPKDLITVHIRWGDKVKEFERGNKRKRMPEMKKVVISDYIEAVNRILHQRGRRNDPSKSITPIANIYLATEDPEAVTEFRKALPAGWNLYVDQYLEDTSRHRVDEYNGSPKMAKALNGKAGLLALGSMLVAMEANDFVLTTKSNWSQLMDELRRAILDPRCGNCTSMIDLRKQQ